MDFLRRVYNHFAPTPHNAFRPYLLSKPWLLFFLTITLTAEGAFLVNIVAHESASNFLAAVLPGEVITFTNVERARSNLSFVEKHPLLQAAAQAKAEDMATKGYFSHTGPDGKEPWAWLTEAGYPYAVAGENLAVRFSESADVVEAWMASPGHRANIVKPVYSEIGVGVAEGVYQGAPATFVVQYFARPVGAASAGFVEPVTLASDTSESAEVLAAATQAQSAGETIAKSVAKLGTSPSTSALWVLGGVGLFLVALVAFTFIRHIQIQPADMLMGGTVIAALALLLFFFNTSVISPVEEVEQTASIFNAAGADIFVGEGGTSTTALHP